MKLFRFRGGIHPAGHKHRTSLRPILTAPMPPRLYVPVQQHIGEAAIPEVLPGQRVLKGQLLARNQGAVSAPVHAPTSGIIDAITHFSAPHPSGLPVLTIVIDADGKDEWEDASTPLDPFDLAPEEIAARASDAGVVGLGGATFPSGIKLNLGLAQKVHTLVVNGGECEPYLTCDDRLMQERAAEVLEGVRLMLHGLQAQRALVAIESNKPAALAAMRRASLAHADVEVVQVPARYPMGSEKQLIKTLLGREVPAGGRTTQLGVVVHNVGTAYAVHRAVRFGRPLVSRVITVSGGAVAMPQNVEAPIGMRVSELLEMCGGLTEKPARLLMGGPMMGQTLPHADVPVVKGTSGILALTESEVRAQASGPCIRCASCVDACPSGLLPLELAARIRAEDFKGAENYGLHDCISCGSCSYVCPSHIPLVHHFNYAKGEIIARKKQQDQAQEIRVLVESRDARLAREAAAKAAAAAAAAARKQAEKSS